MVIRQILPAELSNDHMVSAVNRAALRHEIAMLQQLRSVFLQEPLDRFRARFVGTHMDIANALFHT